MMRKEYIAGLEEIRKRMIEIGQAFAAVDMTDATGMERNRRKKTAKLVGDLADRLYEDIAISAKVAADKAEAGQGEQDDLFDTAPEAGEVVDAEEVEEPAAEVVDVMTTPAKGDMILIEDKSDAKPNGGKPKKRSKKRGK